MAEKRVLMRLQSPCPRARFPSSSCYATELYRLVIMFILWISLKLHTLLRFNNNVALVLVSTSILFANRLGFRKRGFSCISKESIKTYFKWEDDKFTFYNFFSTDKIRQHLFL